MSRPWTPGPWPESVLDDYILEMLVYNEGGDKRANEKLASKAPEMAELLIRVIKNQERTTLDLYSKTDEFGEIMEDVENLLKEIGYADQD